jgi:hypothetical protein
MAEESRLVEDLVSDLSAAIREYGMASEQDKKRTNPTQKRLLEKTRDLADRFRAAVDDELKKCRPKPPKDKP